MIDPEVIDTAVIEAEGEWSESRSRRNTQPLNVGHCVCGPSRTEPRQTEPSRAEPSRAGQLQPGRRQAEEEEEEDEDEDGALQQDWVVLQGRDSLINTITPHCYC